MARVGDRQEFLTAEHLAGRIVRSIHQHDSSSRSDRVFEVRRVKVPIGLPQRHYLAVCSGHGGARRIGVVTRLEHNDLVIHFA